MIGAPQNAVRRKNLSVLLRHVHVQGPTTRAELTALTGLNRSTIGALTAELAEAGLVAEEPSVGRRGSGRPSLLVRPRSDRTYVLAFDIGVDYLFAARVGLGGRVLDRRDLDRPRGQYPLADIMGHVRRFAAELVGAVRGEASCVGVGVAIPALVRHADGLAKSAPNLVWADAPLGAEMTAAVRELGIRAPVHVRNDADLAALAEHLRGAAFGCDYLIYVSGEVGVGAGIIADGKPLAGFGGYSGEIGHTVVNPTGRLCSCGLRGCWETEVGEAAILDAAGLQGGRTTVAEVVAAARGGDERSRAALRHIGGWLALGVGNLVSLFNPEVMIFGGLFREVFPLVRTQVEEALAASGLQPPRQDVRFLEPGLGADSTLLGAAELAFAPLLADPVERHGAVRHA
jgi:predicted NBD/HSP70 family sugar kinase